MGFYRKKPVVIEAIRWTGNSRTQEWPEWLPPQNAWFNPSGDPVAPANVSLEINTLEGTMTASPGDWIIMGVRGEIYPCKPDIFEATYEPANPQEDSRD